MRAAPTSACSAHRTAARGIEIARASLPDVILMDINLPGISGIEALKILRADPATAHIPIIALSANAMPRDIEKGLEAGFFRYLTKPIKVDEFMDSLDLALTFANGSAARPKEVHGMTSTLDILDASILIVDDQEVNVSLLEQTAARRRLHPRRLDHGSAARSARCTARTATT